MIRRKNEKGSPWQTRPRLHGGSSGPFFHHALSRLALLLAFCLPVLPWACSREDDRAAATGLPTARTGKEASSATPEGKVALLLASHRLDEAEQALASLDEQEAEAPWALCGKARILVERALLSEKPEEYPGLDGAEALLRKVLTRDPSCYPARVSLGTVLGLKGNLVEGVKCLEQALREAPDRPDAYFELGRIYAFSGQLDAGVEKIRWGLDRDPNRADGWMLVGKVIYFFRGQQDEGLHAMRKALELDPHLPGAARVLDQALLSLARKALARREYDDVLRITTEVLAREPECAEALLFEAEVLLARGKAAQAEAALRRAMKSAPENEEARRLLARTLVRQGYGLLLSKRKEEAYARFREAVNLNASGVDLTVVKRILEEGPGGAREGEGDTNTSTKATAGEGASSSSSGPEEARLLFREGSALLQTGKAEEALALLRKSLEILPENPYALHQAGLALDALGRTEEAKKELLHALQQADAMQVSIPATYLKLAEIALEADQVDEARSYLDTYDTRYPERKEDPVARSLRRLLILKQGAVDKGKGP